MFYRKEFLQVLDAQILLLEDNLKVAFKIIEPAVSLLKPPYESEIISRDVSSLIDLFPPNAKPDEASLEVELQVFRNHCLASKQGIATMHSRCFELLFEIQRTVSTHIAVLETCSHSSSNIGFKRAKLVKAQIN